MYKDGDYLIYLLDMQAHLDRFKRVATEGNLIKLFGHKHLVINFPNDCYMDEQYLINLSLYPDPIYHQEN